MSVREAISLPPRARLLPLLHAERERSGWLSTDAIAAIAADCRIPVAEAWEAATSYPDFPLSPRLPETLVCTGLSCVLNGAQLRPGEAGTSCQFRCADAPAPGEDAAFPESHIRRSGPLLAPDPVDWAGLEHARSQAGAEALRVIADAGLRGRGGAYFPVARKWEGALAQERPVALIVNGEEGEPGVFKDRAILCRRPRRFLEGLAIAVQILAPAVTIVFLNGEAAAARASLEACLAENEGMLPYPPLVMSGGGGYVLGEETTLINAIEGRKPVPRLRPPYPVESGLFGMPTVVNNVETITTLSLVFRTGPETFRGPGTRDAPGTKLVSLSGRVRHPGMYEVPMGTPVGAVFAAAGGAREGEIVAALVGGPSGGFLPPSEFHRPLLPGPMHPTGAVAGSGGIVVLDSTSDIRAAALAMAAFNADESCGKCTPCREGSPRIHQSLAARDVASLDGLLEVVGVASLCGLGQMAPGPVRSALHFWPELFA